MGVIRMRTILMLLLAIASSNAFAEWVLVDQTNDKSMSSYADSATMRKTGNRVKMWTLDNYKKAYKSGNQAFLSEKSQVEYDCNEAQMRLLSLLQYSAKMGAGEVIFSQFEPSPWTPVVPQSVGMTMWKFACGKR